MKPLHLVWSICIQFIRGSSTGLLGWLGLFQVGKEERSDDIVVHHLGSLKLGVVKPNEESTLDVKVKWNKGSQNKRSLLNNREERKHDPIREPLCVVGRIHRVNSFEGHVCGVEETNEIGNELGPTDNPNGDGKDGREEDKENCFWDLKLVFEFLQAFCMHMHIMIVEEVMCEKLTVCSVLQYSV